MIKEKTQTDAKSFKSSAIENFFVFNNFHCYDFSVKKIE